MDLLAVDGGQPPDIGLVAEHRLGNAQRLDGGEKGRMVKLGTGKRRSNA